MEYWSNMPITPESPTIEAKCKSTCPHGLRCGWGLLTNQIECLDELWRIRGVLLETIKPIAVFTDGEQAGGGVKFCRPKKGILHPNQANYRDWIMYVVLVRGNILYRQKPTDTIAYPK